MGCCSSKSIDTLETNGDKIIGKKISSATVLHKKDNSVDDDLPGNISGIEDDHNKDSEKEIFRKVKKIDSKNKICHCFLIRSIETMEEFAYKEIDISDSNDESSKRMIHDIEILKELNHPNIICLKDAHFSDDKKHLYVFTEYADGGDLQMKLDEYKKNEEKFDEDTLLNWLMQVCLALKYIHDKDILHRDIKPSNIFLMKDNFVKLGDFGVAKTLSKNLKHAKTMVSSPQYLAPEIIKKEKYSFKADIWSLGVTFYQLMFLNYPFEGNNNKEIQDNIVEGKKKEINEPQPYDIKFVELINEMLSNRPDERPSAKDILNKTIIKTRMDCYLKENNFVHLEALKSIKNYEDENDKNNQNKKERQIVVANDEEIKDFITPEKKKKNEEKRIKKAFYDLHRQLTLMQSQIIKKSNTYKK